MNYLIDLLKSISFSPKRLTRKAYSTDTAVIVKAKCLSGQSVTAFEPPGDEWRLEWRAFYRTRRDCQARSFEANLKTSSKSVTCVPLPPLATGAVAGSGCVLYGSAAVKARDFSWCCHFSRSSRMVRHYYTPSAGCRSLHDSVIMPGGIAHLEPPCTNPCPFPPPTAISCG